MKKFIETDLERLYKPHHDSIKGDNGQVTIIGGSSLFHGAPLLALKTASRIVDMVFFSSPEPALEKVAAELKSRLSAFIWVPWEEVEEYIKKSDAILIGPGMMRYHKENQKSKIKNQKYYCDEACQLTKNTTERLLKKFADKQWVIDGGSLQVIDPEFIPKNAILTPNKKEFEMLFKIKDKKLKIKNTNGKSKILEIIQEKARKYDCIIIYKTPETIVCSPEECVLVNGGNAGLTKGGTGDVLAGLTVALAAKNEPFFAACAASFIVKKAADELYSKVGFAYNADDLAEKIPEVLGEYFK